MSAASQLCGENLHFRRQSRHVLNGASLTLRRGELVSLLGANGAGKTTLLRLLLGFDRPERGAVRLDGDDLCRLGRRQVARSLAYVPQAHDAPFPYSVREVAALGRLPWTGLIRQPDRRDADVVNATLERLGIAHLAERPYTAISGGERQLTLIARALAQEARLVVMDEPLNGLDYGNQLRLLERLRRLADQGLGLLMTTHHPDHAATWSTRVAVLMDGRIALDGAAEQVVTPKTIHRLYGVQVADDRARFRPLSGDRSTPARAWR